MKNEYAVDVHNLNKSFNGKPAVINLTLKVKFGEIFGFLGPNGSGKTTTIRMLCGLMTPDSGTGECLGYDIIHDARKIKKLVGYVPQTFSLYQDLTVAENLQFIARAYDERDYRDRVDRIIDDLELNHYRNILAGGLSGGWKQRLSLGCALIHDPKLLLLDEPTAGLDPKARREFWDYISNLAIKGITSLVSTHYMDEAERCNRLAYIMNGLLLAEGNIEEIIQKSGLITYTTTGKNLPLLKKQLEVLPGVEQSVLWGNVLHVSGYDEKLLIKSLQQFSDYQWKRVPSNLEAVFIHLVGISKAEEKT